MQKKKISYEKYTELVFLGLFGKPVYQSDYMVTFRANELIRNQLPSYTEQNFLFSTNLQGKDSVTLKNTRLNSVNKLLLNDSLLNKLVDNSIKQTAIKESLKVNTKKPTDFNFEEKCKEYAKLYFRNTKYLDEFNNNYQDAINFIHENFEVEGLNETKTNNKTEKFVY